MTVVPITSSGPKPATQASPIKVLAPIAWHGQVVPPRRWLVDGLIPRGVVTLLTGDGGLAKSLLTQQLLTAAALGDRWLGYPVPHMRALGVFCEDDPEELHRRQADICRKIDRGLDELEDLSLISRVGEDNVLVEFDRRTDVGMRTALFDQITTMITETGIQVIVVDTAADTFSGNENIRTQVRAFVNSLRSWATKTDGAVILTAHPSVEGIKSGSGISGSTAWSNTVRSRLYLTKAEEEEDSDNSNERILKTKKSNYGPAGGYLRLRWEEGVFTRTDLEDAGGSSLFDKHLVDARLMKGLRYLMANGRKVAADPSAKTGFANVIRAMVPDCKTITFAAAKASQDRMIEDGKLVRVTLGSPSRQTVYVRPEDLRYPEEETFRS